MAKFCFAFFILILAPFLLHAGGDEAIVIYNTRMPESKDVAMDYARLRHVPEKQVFGFYLPTSEIMSRADFRDLLQLPLAEKLETSGLWKFALTKLASTDGSPPHEFRSVVASKIRYAVLCYGVPLRIAPDPTINETEDPAIPPLFQNNGASVDSELVWLPVIEAKPRLSGPMRNWVYGATNTASLNPTNGILLVTRLDGPTADIAMGLVQKSLQAERDGLWGRAYFDARGITDPKYELGDDWILGAAQICTLLGFETVSDRNPETFPADYPMSQIAIYAGWYSGSVTGPFAQHTVEFMPGAFAYHLHSFSAASIRTATDFWCGPLLAKGATCTMGCVDEPSIQFTPNVALFLARWTSGRFTYAEAAWAAQPALSWQTTVIGDPLYSPFAKTPDEYAAELQQTHNPLIDWYYLRLVNSNGVRGVPLSTLEDYLENLPNTDGSALLTEKLASLCDLQGKPETAIEYYERALKLKPTPQQRIRIRLSLAQVLTDQNENGEAIADYQMLLKEFPAYPGADTISARIAALEPSPAK